MGGNLTHTVRDEFDEFAREQLANAAAFPGGGMVFDYLLDGHRFPPDFKGWTDIVQPFTYRKDVPYFQMLVPTVDTVR